MQKAVELLRQTNEDVKAIAGMSGYRSQSHFGQDFRTYTGLTPKQFRAKCFSDESA